MGSQILTHMRVGAGCHGTKRGINSCSHMLHGSHANGAIQTLTSEISDANLGTLCQVVTGIPWLGMGFGSCWGARDQYHLFSGLGHSHTYSPSTLPIPHSVLPPALMALGRSTGSSVGRLMWTCLPELIHTYLQCSSACTRVLRWPIECLGLCSDGFRSQS